MKIPYIDEFGWVVVIAPLVFKLVMENPGDGLPYLPEEVHPTTPPTAVMSCGTNLVTGGRLTKRTIKHAKGFLTGDRFLATRTGPPTSAFIFGLGC
jgi:hypothetical protein